MKLIKLSLVAGLLASSLVAEALSVSGDMTVTSNSLWRGKSGTNNSPTFQGTIGVEHESGLYAGMWGTGMSVGSEIDLYAGFAKEIASGISIDAGFVSYTLTELDTSATATDETDYKWTTDGSGEVYLGLSADVGVELGALLYVEVLSDNSNKRDSKLLELSVGKDFDVLYVGGVYGHQLDSNTPDGYYSATIGTTFESIKGDLSVNYQQSLDTDTDTDTDAVFAVNYTTSF